MSSQAANHQTGSSGSKRARTSPGPSQPASSKKTRLETAPSPPKKPKRSTNQHKMSSSAIPPDAKKLEKCFQLHCRIMWKSLDAKQPPPSPSNQHFQLFNTRFSSQDDIQAALANITYDDVDTSQHIREITMQAKIYKGNSVARDAGRIDSHHLHILFATISQFGLQQWIPDVLGGSPTSLYNAAHETVAIHSFQQLASTFAYASKAPNLKHLNNVALLTKIYRNFVFSIEQKKLVMEAREAGSVLQASIKTDIYKRRKRLRDARMDFMASEGCNERILSLYEEAASHSDDERVTVNREVKYYRKTKEERSASATEWIRITDEARLRVAAGSGGQSAQQHERNREPAPTEYDISISKRFPRNTHLDYFDPTFFNSLPASFRAMYCEAGIALPLPHRLEEDPGRDWKTMPYEGFMKKYGKEVLALYNLPSEAEVEAMKANGYDPETGHYFETDVEEASGEEMQQDD